MERSHEVQSMESKRYRDRSQEKGVTAKRFQPNRCYKVEGNSKRAAPLSGTAKTFDDHCRFVSNATRKAPAPIRPSDQARPLARSCR